jgi:prolyl oligopeptidase
MRTTPDKMGLWASVDRTQSVETVWFVERPGFFDAVFWLGGRTGPKSKLDLPTDVLLEVHRDWLTVKRRTPWMIGTTTYAPDTLLGISLSSFLEGNRDFTVLFEPSERRALEHFFWNDGRLVLSILDELKPVFEVLTPSAQGWERSKLAGLPEVGVVHVWRLDMEEAESNGDLLANAQDPLTPGDHEPARARPRPVVLKQAPRTFIADGLVVTWHEAISIDGERIPYVQVGPPARPGCAGASQWLRRFCRLAAALLQLRHRQALAGARRHQRDRQPRGGGEFGTRWHEAGRLAKKPLSHDDFAAVAADLVRRGVTRRNASRPRAGPTVAS